jgi:hypothetical protein
LLIDEYLPLSERQTIHGVGERPTRRVGLVFDRTENNFRLDASLRIVPATPATEHRPQLADRTAWPFPFIVALMVWSAIFLRGARLRALITTSGDSSCTV